MNKELEEAKVLLSNLKNTTNTQEYVNNFSIYDNAIETVLNYIDNSISKEVIEEKINKYKQQLRNTTKKVLELHVLEQNRMLKKNEIEELSESLRDIDKIRAKIEVLEELLEGK